MTKKVMRAILCLSLAVLGAFGSACTQTAQEQDITGQSHERHETGMESQVGDY